MADMYKEVSLDITKTYLLDACGISVKDRAALKVSEWLEFDEVEVFDAHDGDKVEDYPLDNLRGVVIKKLLIHFQMVLNW